ncbi:hypothetical protein DSM19430T_17430 [Desulfovibrio psychrotolerans]|uniref:Radical SAM core domain-containing protein n=1 Tax=Desulfovibrio psychrotolerans TaxID=415242 RepID=A0A7J0BTL7_9BACT|nr:hypothetical protein DSM19430T_17430 [Desulfovibrio psychrotolerans]
MGLLGASLEDQWAFWRNRYGRSNEAGIFIAYLQSFSNTYGPVEKLRRTLEALEALPDLAGLSIGTRPDCLDSEKLDCIARFAAGNLPCPQHVHAATSGTHDQSVPERHTGQYRNTVPPDGQHRILPGREVWLELGLQSAHDKTLVRINRGHDFAASESAVRMAAERGLRVCAHLIAGLPGETEEDFLLTVDRVNSLPVHGVKFHNLYVAKDTELARHWEQGGYTPLTEEEYLRILVRALPRLRPEIVVQRLTGDAAGDELLAPHWHSGKTAFIASVARGLERLNTWQGKELETSPGPLPPLWFSLRRNLPAHLHRQWEEEFRAMAPILHFNITEPLP